MSWCQRKIQKSVMHVQSCCFASLTSYFFDVLAAVAVVAVIIAKVPYFWQCYLLSAWRLLQQNHQFGEWTQTYFVSLSCTVDWYSVKMFMYSYLVMLGGTVAFYWQSVGVLSHARYPRAWGNQPDSGIWEVFPCGVWRNPGIWNSEFSSRNPWKPAYNS